MDVNLTPENLMKQFSGMALAMEELNENVPKIDKLYKDCERISNEVLDAGNKKFQEISSLQQKSKKELQSMLKEMKELSEECLEVHEMIENFKKEYKTVKRLATDLKKTKAQFQEAIVMMHENYAGLSAEIEQLGKQGLGTVPFGHNNLSETFDLKGMKPTELKLDGKSFRERHWIDLLKTVCRQLFLEYGTDLLCEIGYQDDYLNLYFIQGEEKGPRYFYLQEHNISVYKGGANTIIDEIKCLCKHYGIDVSEAEIYYH